jgi:hypothetical protein
LKSIRPTAPGKRTIFFDAQIPGFGIRVTERSTDECRGSFVLVTRYPGSPNPAPRRIGDYPAMTLAKAREIAREWREDLRQGIEYCWPWTPRRYIRASEVAAAARTLRAGSAARVCRAARLRPEKIRQDEFGDPYVKGPKGRIQSVFKGRFYLPGHCVTAPGDGFLISCPKKFRGLSFGAEARPGVLMAFFLWV